MSDATTPERPAEADFRLAEWLVQPSLNRLSCDDHVIQLEPKLMDVLVFLAENAGRVVSKIEITDAVWPDVYITESVITRSIAGLRRAFGDDVRNPTYIETISKRGYRLIAEVAPEATGSEKGPEPRPLGPWISPTVARPLYPYVVGQWVRGQNFYGRSAMVEEVLGGNRNWLWLLGTRRIGKTSMLKQLELIAATSPELGFVPVFWDLQGADRPDELHLDFAESLLDAEEHLAAVDIDVSDVHADDCFDSLSRLRRKLLSKNLRLLLLCDEVEELIQLNRQDPALLRKLRRAMQSREGIRSVLASSSRLWQLAEAGEDTSPFLDGFTPPLFIGTLSDGEAEDLIRQSQLPGDSRPALGGPEVERIRGHCGNHPYLIQLLCRRALEYGDLDRAIDEVTADRAVGFFFSVDFELLSDAERAIVVLLAEEPKISTHSVFERLTDPLDGLAGHIKALQNMGLVAADEEDRLCLPNDFLQRWLLESQSKA
jgi:DNA-binding winged helix-turn-helix (wHTH) protein